MEDAPTSDRKIVQSRFGIKLRYEFGPEELIHTRSNFSETHRCSARYENIGIGDPAYLTLSNRGFTAVSLAVAVSFFVVSMTVILAYQMEPWLVVIPMWVVPVSFLMVRLLTPFAHHFVLIPVSSDAFGGRGPPVWVWDDALGQRVLDELESRWRARLRSLYAVVDPDNDAQREAAKFQWLRENELIDEAEYQAALGEIEVHCSLFGSERSVN